jgi:ribosomal protein L17
MSHCLLVIERLPLPYLTIPMKRRILFSVNQKFNLIDNHQRHLTVKKNKTTTTTTTAEEYRQTIQQLLKINKSENILIYSNNAPKILKRSIFKLVLTVASTLFISPYLIVLGAILMIHDFIISKQIVSRLYLIKGSNQLGVITKGYFGLNKTFRLHLDTTLFKKKNSGIYIFKHGDALSNAVILTNEGAKFHEKLLFDKYICRVIIK